MPTGGICLRPSPAEVSAQFGDYTAMSDLDLCIVLAEAEDWFERQRRFSRCA